MHFHTQNFQYSVCQWRLQMFSPQCLGPSITLYKLGLQCCSIAVVVQLILLFRKCIDDDRTVVETLAVDMGDIRCSGYRRIHEVSEVCLV